MEWSFWCPVMLCGLVAGGSTGLVGSYIVGMRIPFLGVCVSHAALAGAVLGSLLGLTGQMLFIPALIFALATALLLGLLDQNRMEGDSNLLVGILFSLSMGLAFLGLGMFSVLGKSDHDVRQLLWGSLLFCRWYELKIMAMVTAAILIFVVLFYKEMQALMFSRLHATLAGIHVAVVWTLFLFLVSLALTVNFQTVGGLMIYSLMTNPAIAAFQIVRGGKKILICSAAFGAISGLGGFIISGLTDLPTGAVIVLLSSLIVALAAIARRIGNR
ncbi:MAG: metal ABC transporter permease [Phycisphaerae bacterium]|jgi:manganese/iron transport system permease protein|nr:metal ABC transporter permease [Phycisphaerae bacterium]